VIHHLPVKNPTWDPKDIMTYATPFDREFQNEIDKNITYDQNGHCQETTSSNNLIIQESHTPSPSVGTKAKILDDNDNDILGDGEGVPIKNQENVLTKN
jgi:hypothetical protein